MSHVKVINGRAYLYKGNMLEKKLGKVEEAMKYPEYINYLKRKLKRGEKI
jgi:hypothetical protein